MEALPIGELRAVLDRALVSGGCTRASARRVNSTRVFKTGDQVTDIPPTCIPSVSTYNPPGPCGGIDLKTNALLRHCLTNRNALHRNLAALLLVSVVILAAGCTSKHPGDDVSATVDGRKIYRADVEKYYQNQTSGN